VIETLRSSYVSGSIPTTVGIIGRCRRRRWLPASQGTARSYPWLALAVFRSLAVKIIDRLHPPLMPVAWGLRVQLGHVSGRRSSPLETADLTAIEHSFVLLLRMKSFHFNLQPTATLAPARLCGLQDSVSWSPPSKLIWVRWPRKHAEATKD
jgi:hypothetical protein